MPEALVYDCLSDLCPSRTVLDRISDKWTALIMTLLSERSMRFSELQRTIRGISVKMLTQTLRALERDGLVARKVTPTVPLRVDYALTPLGATLYVTLHELKRWAEANVAEILQARESYDARESLTGAAAP